MSKARVTHRAGFVGVLASGLMIMLLNWPALVAGQSSSGLLYLLQPGELAPESYTPDLFRSPFQDMSGIWSRMPAASPRQAYISSDFSNPISRRLTDGDAEILDRHMKAKVIQPFPIGRTTLYTSTYFERFSQKASSIGKDGSTELRGRGEVAGVDLRLHHPESGTTVMASAPLWHSDSFNAERSAGWGLRFDPSRGWRAQFGRSTHSMGQSFFGRVKDDSLELLGDLETRALGLSGELDFGDRLIVGFGWGDLDLKSRNTIIDADRYDALFSGNGQTFRTGFRFKATESQDLIYRFDRADLFVDSDVYWSGVSFAHLSYVDLDFKTHALGWRWRSRTGHALQADYARTQIEARSRLKVESWPFTSTVIDLLGQSRIYYGTLEATLQRLSLTGTRHTDRTKLRGGFSYFEIEPEARLVSWRPVFLGIGADDIKEDFLDIERAQLLSLLMDLDIDLGRVGLSISAKQFVWVSSDKRESPDGDPGDPGTGIDTKVDNGWIGGTWLRMNLRYYF